jgi:DNA-binding transcriptional LysR family regulator
MLSDNWDDFRFVLAVVEQGSLNAAARVLGVNHATVLRRVNGFQDRYGIEVFDRDSTGYRLRADQGALVAALETLRTAFSQATRAMAGQGAGVHGPVRITSTDSLCQSVLPEAVAHLRERYPNLMLEFLSTNAHLNLGQLDAEVTVRPSIKLPDDLDGVKIGTMAFAVYANSSYLAKVAAGHSEQWLLCSGTLLRAPPGIWQKENVPATSVSMAADSFLSLRQFCRNGLGLAILPCCIVTQNDSLMRLSGYFDTMETSLWVANHRDLTALPRISACRDFLIEAMRAQADVLTGQAMRR